MTGQDHAVRPDARAAPRRHPGRPPAQQPPRDRHRVDRLLPLIERDQRGQPRLQRLRRGNLARCRQRMLRGPPVPQPRQEPRHHGNPGILPPAGLAALLQERPPLRERRSITAHSVRRPQLPVRLQPLLHRPDRRIRRVNHRPRAIPARRPHRQAVSHRHRSFSLLKPGR